MISAQFILPDGTEVAATYNSVTKMWLYEDSWGRPTAVPFGSTKL